MMLIVDRRSASQRHPSAGIPLLPAIVGHDESRELVAGAGESGDPKSFQQRFQRRRFVNCVLPHSCSPPHRCKSWTKG